MQADAKFRARVDDVGLLKVRSDTGEMVPLSALLKIKESAGPERAMRYNGFLTADLNGGGARLFDRAGEGVVERSRQRPSRKASRSSGPT